jgi:predicted nucleotidyltransferase
MEFSIQITDDLIREITQKVVDHFHPKKIVLFGSRAWGSPRPDSDLDLLVIMNSRLRPIARAVSIREVCRPKFVSMDVLVRTPGELRERLRINDPFYLEILKKGKILYEA